MWSTTTPSIWPVGRLHLQAGVARELVSEVLHTAVGAEVLALPETHCRMPLLTGWLSGSPKTGRWASYVDEVAGWYLGDDEP